MGVIEVWPEQLEMLKQYEHQFQSCEQLRAQNVAFHSALLALVERDCASRWFDGFGDASPSAVKDEFASPGCQIWRNELRLEFLVQCLSTLDGSVRRQWNPRLRRFNRW